MFKLILTVSLGSSLSFAQSFSKLAASEDNFLGFTSHKKDTKGLYIDESSSLAWQNSKKLRRYKSVHNAQQYCKSLKLGKHVWALPSLSQIQTLEMTSSLEFTKNSSYLLNDGPVWDNTLSYSFNAQKKEVKTLLSNSKKLYVRCVSDLEA